MYGEKLLKNITGDLTDIQQIMEDFINNINKPELKNINKQELKVPKARIYLTYIGEDMGINVPYDDKLNDSFSLESIFY